MSYINAINPVDRSVVFADMAGADIPKEASSSVGIEKRAKTVADLYFTASELAPLREKLVAMRDRRIMLANLLLTEYERFTKVQSLEGLKAIGLIIGVSLLALTALAALGGVVFGTVCLASIIAPLVAMPWLIWSLMGIVILAEIPVLGIAGFKIAELLFCLLASGVEVRPNEILVYLHHQAPNWLIHYMPGSDISNAVETAKKSLPMLERLRESDFLETVIEGYVRNQIDTSVMFKQSIEIGDKEGVIKAINAELDNEESMLCLSQRSEVGLLFNRVMFILPGLIKAYPQLQVKKAAQ